MMYNNKLVASIRSNGKILREFKDTVFIPFGSEYSVLLKNLNTVRALVNVYIDGDNVVPGGLVLYGGQEIDLERAIRNGNMKEGNKFKFIERTGNIENHRGIKVEDGLIRVEFQFEKVYQRQDGLVWHTTSYPSYNNTYNVKLGGSALRNTSIKGMASPDSVWTSCAAGGMTTSATVSAMNCMDPGAMLMGSADATLTSYAAPQNETGITVAGGKSEQQFTTASWFATESTKHSIILRLLGETEDNKVVREAVTVKKKPKCTTCGKQNKANAKFCSECGTALEIFA